MPLGMADRQCHIFQDINPQMASLFQPCIWHGMTIITVRNISAADEVPTTNTSQLCLYAGNYRCSHPRATQPPPVRVVTEPQSPPGPMFENRHLHNHSVINQSGSTANDKKTGRIFADPQINIGMKYWY